MLSNSSACGVASVAEMDTTTDIMINGATFRHINAHKSTYRIRSFDIESNQHGSLVDSGANGGLAGGDVCLMETTFVLANVTGVADHTVEDLPICTVSGVVQTTTGPIIVFLHQYAHYGKGTSLHSVAQLASFGLIVDECS